MKKTIEFLSKLRWISAIFYGIIDQVVLFYVIDKSYSITGFFLLIYWLANWWIYSGSN